MTVLFENETGVRISAPQTLDEARKQAPNAKWHFLQDRINFAYATSTSTPIFIALPGGDVYLMQSLLFDAEIKDSKGMPVDPEVIRRNWGVFGPIVMSALRDAGAFLKFVPLELREYDLCFAAVKDSPEAFEFVPLRHKSKELCFEAVTKRGDLLEIVPPALVDYELCLAAVRSAGYAFRFVPPQFVDVRLLEVALETCGEVLSYAPDGMVTRDLYLKAVLASPELIYDAKEYGVSDFLTEDFCEQIIRVSGGTSIDCIPKEFWTPRLCRLAVVKDPAAISDVPIGLLDDETIMRAVLSSPKIISFLPDSRKTRKLCEIAVTVDPDVVYDIPKGMLDDHIRARAIRERGERGIGSEAYSAASRAFDIAKLRNSVDRWFSGQGAG